MKVTHCVPLVTPDGAYGGPVTVAVNQLLELQRRGHQVELVAGTSGFSELPTTWGGVPARLFPVRRVLPRVGFAGITSLGLLSYLRHRRHEVDVVHVHVARDLLSLPAAHLANRSRAAVVLQPHGMIDRSSRLSATVLDRVLTRRVFAAAGTVLTLTDEEDAEMNALGLALRPRRIVNGIHVSAAGAPSGSDVQGERSGVLFLARLHPRKRAALFAQMAAELGPEFPSVPFSIGGPDEGELPAVRKLIADHADVDIRYLGSLTSAEASRALGSAAVYVLPSVGEVFPMTVLEAMAAGCPVVITKSNGLAGALAEAQAAVVVGDTLAELKAGVRSLMEDESLRVSIAGRASELVSKRWSIESVADDLEGIYEAGRSRA